MNDFIFTQLLPKIDSLTEKVKRLEQNQKQVPALEVNIESTDCDNLISQIQKLYQNFSGGCNLKISVQLKEV